ncbi:MAG TPA: hypothetical protein VGP47_00230 [Parachlamydiaceae bacterium]|nr:hypothetical protein [Parachlamydiaceae bacterium]
MTMQSTSVTNSPPSMQTYVSQIPTEKSIPAKLAACAISSTVQFPINFGANYASLYLMQKSVQITSSTVGFVYSSVSSLLGSAYCTIASCPPTIEINTASELILKTTNSSGIDDPALINSAAPDWKGNLSMFAAMSISIRPVASHCFNQLLGCKEDTPLRNMTAIVATSITTTALASYATNLMGDFLSCNVSEQLKFETDTAMLVKGNVIALAIAPLYLFALSKLNNPIKQDEDQLLPTEDDVQTFENTDSLSSETNSIDLESEAQPSLDPVRVKHLSDSTLIKIQELKQNILKAKNQLKINPSA